MKNEDQVVFPFKVDVPSFPERRWVRACRIFVYIICINLVFSLAFAFLLLLYSDKKTTFPAFLYFSNKYSKFEKLEFKDMALKKDMSISQRALLEEQFIKTYLEARYNVNDFMADNLYKWCNCIVDENGKRIIRNSYLKRENIRCSLCMMSEADVYTNFIKKERDGLVNNLKTYGPSRIQVNNIKKVMEVSSKNSGSFPYNIYMVEMKTYYADRTFINQRVFLGVASVQAVNEKRLKEEEKIHFEAQPYLFKVVSFSVSDFTGGKKK